MELKTMARIILATPAKMPRERMRIKERRVRRLRRRVMMSGMGRSARRKSVKQFTTGYSLDNDSKFGETRLLTSVEKRDLPKGVLGEALRFAFTEWWRSKRVVPACCHRNASPDLQSMISIDQQTWMFRRYSPVFQHMPGGTPAGRRSNHTETNDISSLSQISTRRKRLRF